MSACVFRSDDVDSRSDYFQFVAPGDRVEGSSWEFVDMFDERMPVSPQPMGIPPGVAVVRVATKEFLILFSTGLDQRLSWTYAKARL